MHWIKKILFTLIVVTFFNHISAQTDTVKVEKKANNSTYRQARIATVMSAVLPGAGQAYNKKYWKIPIIYAGLGGFGYMLFANQERYEFYGSKLRAENDNDPNTINDTGYDSDNLLRIKNKYRKDRDLGIIGCAIIYALNILDANVDAHLRTFDVSDNLSLQVKPYQNLYLTNNNQYGFQTGIALNFKFK